ncbi:MAG: glycosyltransferase [Candidatus Saccharimonadales bacterium]
MLKDILFYSFAVIAIINTVHFGLYIAGANIYDIKQLRNKKNPKYRKVNPRPLVTVIVPAHNEESGIVKTLESIRKSTYRKLQILVVDDASTDKTRKLVWRYIKDHPRMDLHLLRKQKNVGKGEAINHALKTMTKGELFMTIDADSEIGKKSISNAVRHFDNPSIIGLAANVQVQDEGSVLSLLQKFEHMIGYRSKKFYTISNSEFIIGGVASTYRTDLVRRAGYYDTDTLTEDIGLSLKMANHYGNVNTRLIYASDVLAMTQGVQSFKALFRQRYRWKMGMLQNMTKFGRLVMNNNPTYSRMLTMYRLPVAIFGEMVLLIEPILLAYIIYLSAITVNPASLISAYVAITLYILWNIWPDEHLGINEKLRLSFYAPLMYFVFYIMNAVQLIAIIRCLKNNQQVLRKKATGGTWVSPERAGAI